jgi:transcription elongation GreA/GreB family factor
MNGLKKQLFASCQAYITSRIKEIEIALASAQASANEETKSSAGDKYETGRSMLQLEMEKHHEQLNEALRTMELLKQIDIDKTGDSVQPGSLVITNQGKYFIAIAAGLLSIDGEKIYAVSTASPIGGKLVGKKIGEQFELNNRAFSIQQLF